MEIGAIQFQGIRVPYHRPLGPFACKHVKHDFIENDIVILSKQTLDLLFRQSNPDQMIALYTFYYYTAKWQGTNQPKVATSYAAKGLHWNTHKVIACKKQLIELGLIEDVRDIDERTKRVKGWYIRMKYIWKQDTITQHLSQNGQIPQGGNSHPVEMNQTNALSANSLNALSANKEILAAPSAAWSSKDVQELIDLFKLVNPMHDQLFKNTTQQASIQRMLEKYVRDKLEQIIRVLPKTNEDRFAPTITTPHQLEVNLGKLAAYFKRSQASSPKLVRL